MSPASDPRAGRGLFVAGTDTGVGKTRVACELLRGLRARGLRVAGLKPVETGVGEAGPVDALALREAAGGGSPLADVCPQYFALPAAPSVAARAERRRVDLDLIEAAYARLCSAHDVVVVEGAGGLRVPLDDDLDMAALARRFEAPVLLVARAALGTLNHTLLSLEALASEGIGLLGVVVSHTQCALRDAHAQNLAELKRRLGERLLGELPHTAPGALAPAGWLDLEALWKRLEALRAGRLEPEPRSPRPQLAEGPKRQRPSTQVS